MYGGVEVQLHAILTFKTDRGEESALLLHRQLLSTVDWKHKHQTLSGYCGEDTNPCPHHHSNYSDTSANEDNSFRNHIR